MCPVVRRRRSYASTLPRAAADAVDVVSFRGVGAGVAGIADAVGVGIGARRICIQGTVVALVREAVVVGVGVAAVAGAVAAP